MHDWHFWDVMPVTESLSVMGHGSRPGQGVVDVNTGDLETPVMRGRHVAKEFANTKSDDFFSPTPPLEALRLLLSLAKLLGGRQALEVAKSWYVDARKAHLHAFAERNLYVCTRARGACAKVCVRD